MPEALFNALPVKQQSYKDVFLDALIVGPLSEWDSANETVIGTWCALL